jgi:excisionase family DNA binding protein
MASDAFFTAKDIAKTLKISNALSYKLIASGQIRGVRFGRTVRVRQEDLEQFISENMTAKNSDRSKSN